MLILFPEATGSMGGANLLHMIDKYYNQDLDVSCWQVCLLLFPPDLGKSRLFRMVWAPVGAGQYCA